MSSGLPIGLHGHPGEFSFNHWEILQVLLSTRPPQTLAQQENHMKARLPMWSAFTDGESEAVKR